MADVEHDRVGKHYDGLENIEEPLISNDWGHCLGVKARSDLQLGHTEVLYQTVDGSRQYEPSARIERDQRAFQPIIFNSMPATLKIEQCSQVDEGYGHDDL